MKSVLISIQPKWCELIASGKKTVEVRKTRPKLETPFKVYIYCTSQGSNEFFQSLKNRLGEYEALSKWNRENWGIKKGKVIGEFVCDEITVAKLGNYCALPKSKTLIDALDLMDYADDKTLYGWHISDLVIYNEPMELCWCYNDCEQYDCNRDCPYFYVENTPNCYECGCMVDEKIPIQRPPQSWRYIDGVRWEE